MNRRDLQAVALIFCVVFGALMAVDTGVMVSKGAEGKPPTPAEAATSGGPGVTIFEPRWGFDGRIHMLPGLMPGIGF